MAGQQTRWGEQTKKRQLFSDPHSEFDFEG